MRQHFNLNPKNKQCKSKVMAAIHKTSEDLHAAQVMSAQALREFDTLCLTLEQKLLSEPETSPETRSGTLSA